MKVVIVGGGVIGLAAAYALVQAGCDVILLDAQDVPNPSSASYDLSRMMRLQYGPQSGYARLAKRALTSWDRLQNELGVHLYEPTGVCVWSGSANTWSEATQHALRRAGVAYRLVSPESAAGRFIEHAAVGDGIWTEEGGVLLAKSVISALAAAVARKGALLRPKTEATSVDAARGTVRTKVGDVIQGDAVIIAAGAWTAKLFPDLAGRLTPIRSIAIYVSPSSQIAADWAAAPCTMIETRESMLYALPPVPGAPLKLAGTANLRPADPNHPEPVSPQEARAVLEAFRPYLPNIDGYNIIGTAMGHYADPPDKTFIVERRDRTTIISGCGGRMFKFAPLLGEEIAAALTGTAAASQIDHWTMPLATHGQAPA
jgi:glycine/D-amino acid oxidase-like deaminating enzyme